MKEWRNYDNPHDIQGFLRALRDMCDSDATWEQYVFIVNNYLEKDLPELRYIRDSRSHENILNNIIEVNKKILKLSDKREGKITYSGSDTGERKIPQRGSDTGNRKVIQSRTSPVEPSWEGNKKKIQDFETVESKVPVSDRTEYIPSSDASETLIPDEASPQGSIEITDIAQGGKKSFTPRELKEFRERWIIPIKNK